MATTTPKPKTTTPVRVQRCRLVFDDGTEQTVNIGRPGLLLAFEREHGQPPEEGVHDVMRLAWVSSGRPATFDEWVETISDFDLVTVDHPGKATS